MIPQIDLFLSVFWRKSKTQANHFEIICPLMSAHLFGHALIFATLDKKAQIAVFHVNLWQDILGVVIPKNSLNNYCIQKCESTTNFNLALRFFDIVVKITASIV